MSKELLKTVCAEVASLKKQVACADMENPDSNSHMAEAGQVSEHCLIPLNFALVSCNRAEKLTRVLGNKFVNTVDPVAQQLGHDE